jgi:hypothetical protein
LPKPARPDQREQTLEGVRRYMEEALEQVLEIFADPVTERYRERVDTIINIGENCRGLDPLRPLEILPCPIFDKDSRCFQKGRERD